MNKLFSQLILGCFLSFTSASLFAVQVIELAGDKSYPPYSYSEKGVAKGGLC